MEFNSYVVLARPNVEVVPLLRLNFKEIFIAIHRRLNILTTINDPWRIVTAHKIHADIFIQFSQAVPDYKIQLGVTIADIKGDRSEKST